MDSPLPSSPICDQPDTFSPVEDFEEKMLEAGDAVLCPHTLRVVRSQSFTGKATDGAQRVVRSRSFTAKILCEEASDGAEDLDNVIWTGDDAEVNISPYHPLHKGAPLPADEEERNEVLLAEVCAHLVPLPLGGELRRSLLDIWPRIQPALQSQHQDSMRMVVSYARHNYPAGSRRPGAQSSCSRLRLVPLLPVGCPGTSHRTPQPPAAVPALRRPDTDWISWMRCRE